MSTDDTIVLAMIVANDVFIELGGRDKPPRVAELCPTKGSDPLPEGDIRITKTNGKGSDPFVEQSGSRHSFIRMKEVSRWNRFEACLASVSPN